MKDKNVLKNKNPDRKESAPAMIIVPLLIYLGATVMISIVSRQQGVMPFLGGMIPYSSFTGVFSSIANISIIFMVVFFKKIGFIISVTILLAQFPLIFLQFIINHNVSSLPGIFTNLLTVIAIVLIVRRNKRIDRYQKAEIDQLTTRQRFSQRLFEQTATALVNAIDAKDPYSHGHSLRVAEYSEKIARMLGKNEDECYKIYYTALLHDVGKIGIPLEIINKKGRLTDEEYDIIKNHPVMGYQILSSISEYPYLNIGARYHHERYDGRGYPDRLKGEDIPEIARIISVADAYDAMSSNRSYRDAIPQQLVREEIIKGAGTQFDPEFAKAMQKLIDLDTDYKMKERRKKFGVAERNSIECDEHRSEISDSILVIPFKAKIHMTVTPNGKSFDKGACASIILFDSLDARVHGEENTIKELYYYEYCEIWLDGRVENSGARKIVTNVTESKKENKNSPDKIDYVIEASKRKDHALITIDDGNCMREVIVALPDSSRYVYLSATGQYCEISEFNYEREKKWISDDHIPRIAEKISFIDNMPEGNIPNLQVDGHMTEATDGIPLTGNLELSFHAMSLPTARLIWHCPYLAIYSSEDGKRYGKGYKEYAVVRLDGEVLELNDETAKNKLSVTKSDEFVSWDNWKEKNKKGYDSKISISREKNKVTTVTDNLGIGVVNETVILEEIDNIYVALTGDQCALTGINLS